MVLGAGEDEREVELEEGEHYHLGRDSADADCVVDHEDVSRVHAQVHFDPAQRRWLFRDLNSTNGSFLQGRRLTTADEPIEEGDVFLLGGEHARVRFLRSPRARKTVEGARKSIAARALEEEIELIVRSPESVLIFGPSGAGKTTLAHQLHERSLANPKATLVEGAFIAVNCGSLTSDLTHLRSEFFGHVKGAYAGATHDRVGRLTAAAKGTLFLDEIESLPPAGAAFLLDVLDGQGNANPLGADENRHVPIPRFRLMASTKQPFSELQLRKDLSNRLLNGHIVFMPSLAERREDIPGFVKTFVQAAAKARAAEFEFGPGALEAFLDFDWPGEVRELLGVSRMVLHRAALAGARPIRITAEAVRDEINKRRKIRGLTAPPEKSPAGTLTREALLAALARHKNAISPTARELGIARNTLKSRMDEFGIRREAQKD